MPGSAAWSAVTDKPIIPGLSKFTFNLVPGTVTLGTKELTITVNGLLASDAVVIQPTAPFP